LKELYCGNNRLTALDVSKSVLLMFLDCSDNSFSATALNELFKTLNAAGGNKTIEIYSNPGCESCDRSIARNKGWQVSEECW
jgi:Leucine-rich repeat (LRR) protein